MAKKCKESPKWLTTFSDLMSLLMTFFVLLFSMSSVDAKKYEQAVQSLTESLTGGSGLLPEQAAYFKQQSSASTEQPGGSSMIEDLKPLYESLIETYATASGQNSDIKLEYDAKTQQIKAIFPELISFDPGSAELKLRFRFLLRKLAILRHEPIKIKIVGHTDKRPIHSERFKSNWDLSAARAAAVADELIIAKIFAPQQIEVVGIADTQPVDLRDTPEAYAKNRRVEILIEPLKNQPEVLQKIKELDASKAEPIAK